MSAEHIIKTADPEMKRVLQLATNVASSRATVLISGESGTGKEVLARLVHAKSPRAPRRMIAVNCAAMANEVIEAELFGVEKCLITGAQAKHGKFEQAHQSTFLIDEISELSLPMQARLLRVIQDGEVERIGAKVSIKVNVRIIATTNKDLASMVRSGLFREDLYYRLNVIPLAIPALRNRPRDIEELACFFAEVSGLVNNMSEKRLAPDAITKLKEWNWPGNVRELENVIERSILLAPSNHVTAIDIEIPGFEKTETPAGDLVPGMTISEAEKRLIMKTLEYTSQNRTKAAGLLGISIRTLRNKLHEYGVAPVLAPVLGQVSEERTDG